jgi:hypothetical protein
MAFLQDVSAFRRQWTAVTFQSKMALLYAVASGTHTRSNMSYKSWFRAGAVAILSLALSSTFAVSQGNGHGHGHDKDGDDYEHGHGNGHGNGHAYGHDRYSDHDRDQIRGWYRTHYSNLPPGLAKRDRLPPGLQRQLVVRGTLPPGLQKKMYPCPHDLEVMLPPPPPNYAHVVIGGNVVLLNRANFQIADIFHLDVAIR